MSERFKELVLKTSDGATHRGFESHSLRHSKIPVPVTGVFGFWYGIRGRKTSEKIIEIF